MVRSTSDYGVTRNVSCIGAPVVLASLSHNRVSGGGTTTKIGFAFEHRTLGRYAVEFENDGELSVRTFCCHYYAVELDSVSVCSLCREPSLISRERGQSWVDWLGWSEYDLLVEFQYAQSVLDGLFAGELDTVGSVPSFSVEVAGCTLTVESEPSNALFWVFGANSEPIGSLCVDEFGVVSVGAESGFGVRHGWTVTVSDRETGDSTKLMYAADYDRTLHKLAVERNVNADDFRDMVRFGFRGFVARRVHAELESRLVNVGPFKL